MTVLGIISSISWLISVQSLLRGKRLAALLSEGMCQN
nr:MAG TPA: hypothetical protein [Caudoviricetes sp.]